MPEINHRRWVIPPRIPASVDQSLKNYPAVLRQLLYNRGIATEAGAQHFLNAANIENTHPTNLSGLQTAIERIARAIERQEEIVIYGDYDVDGVTATALLTLTLQYLGAEVRPYIPNRFDEGYGLNPEAIKALKEQGVRLVITVDCGIRSPEEAKLAKKIGLDLIITDHHHPGEVLPEALALINPKLEGDQYPEKNLAGVGIAYKLAQGLTEYLEATHIAIDEMLDLVALGTVADLAPLTGENRHFVRRGVRQLQTTQRQGLHSLANVAGVSLSRLTASDIGFMLGPRLNAAGRLDSALAALELLLTNDVMEAGRLAQQLDVQNRERQQITREIQVTAEEVAFAQDPDATLIFAAHPEFNPGVIGLAASRLTETYYRPSIVASIGEETTRGSCRSIPEFHITQALDACSDILIRHGGHAAAAGFTVSNEHLPELRRRLSEYAYRELGERELRPTLVADMEINLSQLNSEILKYLQWIEPTGYGNQAVQFVSRNLYVDRHRSRAVGKEQAHLKLVVSDGRVTFDAIAFRQGKWASRLPDRIDLLYQFETNEYNGQVNLQLNVRDIRPAGLPD